LFTASGRFPARWPQAGQHTQWPGTGLRGDPIFDAVFASQMPFPENTELMEVGFRAAMRPLLEELGPVVLLTHSRGACLGWVLCDEHPDLVCAVVTVEPAGPPAANYFNGLAHLPWGLTNSPIGYDPPTAPPENLRWKASHSEGAGDPYMLYAGEPRTLASLLSTPVLVVTGEASYHAAYDHITVEFLKTMSVTVSHMQ
ncbi:unnamed protein product, partial [Ectocarpus fasciculatus]